MQARCLRFALLAVAGVVVLLASSADMYAQGNSSLQEGWNGATQSSSTHSPSFAFVDGVGYVNDSRCTGGGGRNICQIIQYALQDYSTNSNGVVSNGVTIDTRGISSLTCTSTASPWSFLTANFSNIVLLPAGTITIAHSWTLPDDTRLIGEGSTSTIIQAGFNTSNRGIIEMGGTVFACDSNGNTNCPWIAVEHLQLNGNGNTNVNGIMNCCAQEHSRVNDVSIVGVNVGLALTDGFAQNSGPYTNLSMSNVYQCLTIEPGGPPNMLSVTRGVHGLTCSTTGAAPSAIQIDTPNNSLEDIYISGGSTQDGVLIGSQAQAQGNVLLNISGSGLNNVVHIAHSFPSPDISILGVSRSGGAYTIYDELAGTALTDTNLGMYILGELIPVGSGTFGYSRFTTSISTNAPTWLVGGSAPTGSCGVGSLYSCTGSTSACTISSSSKQATVWQCLGGGTWGVIK